MDINMEDNILNDVWKDLIEVWTEIKDELIDNE